MASLLTTLGLFGTPAAAVPNYSPIFIGWQFFYAYGLLSSRTLKQWYGLDHQVSPREDLAKFGETAVHEGKITRKQLDMLKRNESAHANSVENFAFIAASLAIATAAGVPAHIINAGGLSYTLARLVYGPVYILIDDPAWSGVRAWVWWWGNVSCFSLLWQAQKHFFAQAA